MEWVCEMAWLMLTRSDFSCRFFTARVLRRRLHSDPSPSPRRPFPPHQPRRPASLLSAPGIPVILNRNFNLPGLNYTRSQMIYIGFSQVWCSLVRPETAIQRIRTDPHSPANWRVIGALSDSEGFAEAWGCPKKARMNPEGKCVLW